MLSDPLFENHLHCELVAPINAELRAAARQQLADSDSSKEKDTPMLALIIPANSSASAFIKTLAYNNSTGLMFETEGDTLSQILKSDYGNYSDTLRKAFHHEPVSLCRRKDREFLEVDCPKLSVVLAGTPGQVPGHQDRSVTSYRIPRTGCPAVSCSSI